MPHDINTARDLQNRVRTIRNTADRLLIALCDFKQEPGFEPFGTLTKQGEQFVFSTLGANYLVQTRLVKTGQGPYTDYFVAFDLVDDRAASPRTVASWYLNRFGELRVSTEETSSLDGIVFDTERGAGVIRILSAFMEAVIADLPSR